MTAASAAASGSSSIHCRGILSVLRALVEPVKVGFVAGSSIFIDLQGFDSSSFTKTSAEVFVLTDKANLVGAGLED